MTLEEFEAALREQAVAARKAGWIVCGAPVVVPVEGGMSLDEFEAALRANAAEARRAGWIVCGTGAPAEDDGGAFEEARGCEDPTEGGTASEGGKGNWNAPFWDDDASYDTPYVMRWPLGGTWNLKAKQRRMPMPTVRRARTMPRS